MSNLTGMPRLVNCAATLWVANTDRALARGEPVEDYGSWRDRIGRGMPDHYRDLVWLEIKGIVLHGSYPEVWVHLRERGVRGI